MFSGSNHRPVVLQWGRIRHGAARFRTSGIMMRRHAVIASALLLLAGAAARPALADTEVTFGVTSATGFNLAHFVAIEKKYYETEKLKVDMIVAGAAVGVLQQLTAGSLNMAQAATDQSLRAILRGAPVKIVAGAASNAPFRVVAAKTIRGWSDLKGKTISVGGLTDVTLYFLRVMARKNGLADQDYDLLFAGGTPARFAQLVSGAVAAAMLTNPVDFSALEQGYVDLGSVPQYLPNWAQNNILVDTRWAAQNRDTVLAFLRAHIKASNYIYEPAHRDEIIAILAKHTKATPQIAAATYDLYIKQGVIARGAALYEDGIKANFDALVALGDLATAPPLDRFVDGSFLAEATKPRSQP
jgi:ABC-type nitrate/sulfonate/bicarbonate transport system substrate-binding protein